MSLLLSLCSLETKSSAVKSVGTEHHYGNQHSGPGCGCSWISAETFFLLFFFWRPLCARVHYRVYLLNLLPGSASDLIGAISSLVKNRHVFSGKRCCYNIKFLQESKKKERESEACDTPLSFSMAQRVQTHTHRQNQRHTFVNVK